MKYHARNQATNGEDYETSTCNDPARADRFFEAVVAEAGDRDRNADEAEQNEPPESC
ncbi:MAG: hypothetical protein K6F57_01620 [Candidatus Saccharibacteria bacterium]|nr:hypothetical protein [Candidatus Saccharibacteria bacterium]